MSIDDRIRVDGEPMPVVPLAGIPGPIRRFEVRDEIDARDPELEPSPPGPHARNSAAEALGACARAAPRS